MSDFPRHWSITFDAFTVFRKKSGNRTDGPTADQYQQSLPAPQKRAGDSWPTTGTRSSLSRRFCFLASWWLVGAMRHLPAEAEFRVMASIELSQRGGNPFVDQLLSWKIILVKVISSTIKVIGGGILGRGSDHTGRSGDLQAGARPASEMVDIRYREQRDPGGQGSRLGCGIQYAARWNRLCDRGIVETPYPFL